LASVSSIAAAVLDVDADEPLERSEDRPVEHDRAVLLAVVPDVVELEALRQVRVVLHRAERPASFQCILHVKFHLRPVERALAMIQSG
jgi:hypothetical protein